MKIVIALGFVCSLLLISAQDPADSISITGEDIIPGGPSTIEEGDVVDASQTQTEHRDASSNAPEGQLLPTYCPYPDKDFPACGLWNDGTHDAATVNDCLRLCKELEGCDRTLFNEALGKCTLNAVDVDAPGNCEVSDSADNLQDSPGATLFVRQVAGDGGECPGGVGPTGLPEDQFVSAHFCKIVGKSCSTTGAYLSKPKSDDFQCKAECNSQVACAAAISVKPKSTPSADRMCHLLTSRCQSLVADAASDTVKTTTFYRMTKADYDARVLALLADPDDTDAGCPPGSTYYNQEPVIYLDKFCIVAATGFCPGTDGRMYKGWQNFNDVEGCMNKCAAYPTCGAIEFNLSKFNSGADNAKWSCNMRDTDICSPNEVIQSPGGDQGQVRIRMKPDQDGTYKCPVGSNPGDSVTEWGAKFCITYDRTCPASAVVDRETSAAESLVDCLTQCRNLAGCESATFQGGECVLIKGKCTQEQLQISILKKYYTRTDVNTACPPIVCPDNSQAELTSVCPNTCSNPQASNDCNIQTLRCVCTGDHLDHEGQCIHKDQCPDNDCPEMRPTQPTLVSDDGFAKVWRIMEHPAQDVVDAKRCATGAVVKSERPCPNTCVDLDARASCPIEEAVPSCHCADEAQVWDESTHICRDPVGCPA